MSELEFQRLYEETAGPIRGYLVAITGRRDVADDLLQETYCRLLVQQKAARTSSMSADETRRYLFRIATNLLRDRWRSREDRPFTDAVEASQMPNLDSCIDTRAMLRELRPRDRELLWLAYVEGMDHTEIAAVTGLGRLSIRMLLFRARKRAKDLLDSTKDKR